MKVRLKGTYKTSYRVITKEANRIMFNVNLSIFFYNYILKKERFNITFKGRYIDNFFQRVFKTICWIYDLCLYKTVTRLVYIKNKDINYSYLKPSRYIAIKLSNTPNEYLLEEYLSYKGYKVVDEVLYPEDTVYVVEKVRDK